uniref:Receptor kinase-like protein Xa21 n=1 Tax=Oryza brachyantha TaxID=4533 RepID=J3LW43_ORYBR
MAPAILNLSICSSMSLIRAIVLLVHVIILLSCHAVKQSAAQSVNSSEMDRQALLSFKAGISSDPLGVLRSWRSDSLNFCSWSGVMCGMALPLRVTSLVLNSRQLNGTLSPSVANLTSLRQLDLANNQLWGGIPEKLSMLQNLQSLLLASNKIAGDIPGLLGTTSKSLRVVNLANNMLSGGIPRSLATSSSLTVLNLTTNLLSGTIPATLFNGSSHLAVVDLQRNSFSGPIPNFYKMSALQVLNLADNSLSGSIPQSLGNVSSINHISLAMNSLEGSIPETLSNIKNLTVLNLGYNILTGYVPAMIYNSSSLISISLSYNSLSGNIPSSIGYSLPNIERLIMSDNNMEGFIPASLANASKLQLIVLDNNKLAGPVPSLGSLSSLYGLSLGYNYLESEDWSFLKSLTNCTQLEYLAMGGNVLNGTLLTSVGNLSKSLAFLHFEKNQLIGRIPAEIGNLVGLISLKLGQNQFVGTIPIVISNLLNLQRLDMGQNLLSSEIPSVIGNLPLMIILNLSGNKLSGQITTKIGNLSRLTELYLDNNNLSGNIPASLSYGEQLVLLNLSSNNLSGSIPLQLFNSTYSFVSLDLSNNLLTGSIPTQIGRLINLVVLDISFNKFSGEIPSSLGQCVSLGSLNMKNNILIGNIPQLDKLKSIFLLDLSRNMFVGQIPEFLVNFSLLNHLDLSNNYFEGPIPTGGIFQNISAVTFDGNTRLCSSSSTSIFGFPSCPTVSPVKRRNNAHLLIIVIPPVTIAIFSFFCFMMTLMKGKQAHTNSCYKETMKKVSYTDILKATNWFSPVNKIRSSHTGSIYIGRFQFETDLIAIKLFHLDELGAYNSFHIECEVLRNTRHRNLVKAITVCSTVDLENNEFKAIVFEFMANGSLDMWIHPKLHQNSPKRGLSLGQIRIAADVAFALDYMHNQLTPPLIHCDLKPSNVLLDYDMTARVGDFGSAKFLNSSSCRSECLIGVRGTIGYIAPEYGMGYKISTGCDVYSFGVLLLEMLTGKRPTDPLFTDGSNLHKFVSMVFPDNLQEILDPHMPKEEHHSCSALLMQTYVETLVEVGLLCSMESPKDRPGMGDVSAKLIAIREAFSEVLYVEKYSMY